MRVPSMNIMKISDDMFGDANKNPLLRRLSATSAVLFAMATMVAALFVLSHIASAQSPYSIDSFDADITVNTDSSIIVEETIKTTFNEPKHGIFRTIPVRYRDASGNRASVDLSVSSVTDESGGAYRYEVSDEFNNVKMKIGDPEATLTGPHTYVIKYRADDVILHFKDHAELYWNVTGTDWDVPIKNIRARVRLPGGFPIDAGNVSCYTGAFGSRGKQCTITVSSGGVAEFHAADFLTVSVGAPAGLIPGPLPGSRVIRFIKNNPIVFLPVAVFLVLFLIWWIQGRDPHGRGVVMAQFEPPKRSDARDDFMSPAEVGTLIDAKVHPRDLSAVIVDWAVRGFLKIREDAVKELFGEDRRFTLVKVKDPGEGELRKHEKILWDYFFDDRVEISLHAIKDDATEAKLFVKARQDAERELYEYMATGGFFVKNPNTVRAVYIGVGVATVIFTFWFLTGIGAAGVASLTVCGALFFIFSPYMPKKTKKGALAFEDARGFLEYLSRAEKYRLQWQEKEHIFEKFLPYAMTFGVVNAWAKNFENIYRNPPSWYEGDFARGFSWIYFTSSFGRFQHDLTGVAALTPASRGGSGLGGSGFSGGGFGGGGGGSW